MVHETDSGSGSTGGTGSSSGNIALADPGPSTTWLTATSTVSLKVGVQTLKLFVAPGSIMYLDKFTFEKSQ